MALYVDPPYRGYELDNDGTSEFFFTQRLEPVKPPAGESDFFGLGHHFRFYHHIRLDDVVIKGGLIQNFDPNAITDKDKHARLSLGSYYPTPGSVPAVIDYLYRVVATKVPF